MIKRSCFLLLLSLLSFNVSATKYACESGRFAEQKQMPASDIEWVIDRDEDAADGSVTFLVMGKSQLEGREFVALNAFVLRNKMVVMYFPIYAGVDGGVVYANFTLPEHLLGSFELRYSYVEHNRGCEKLYVYRALPAHNK
jgi:hypothetical protein